MTVDGGTVSARGYQSGDEEELLRLLRILYTDMHGVYGGEPPLLDQAWEERVLAALDRRLRDDVAVFVVDGAEGRLAALAGGRVSCGLPSPRRRHIGEAHIDWVVTDPAHRGRGFASAAVTRLLRWFREQDALSVSLHSSPAAESLYERLGFSDGGPRSLSLRLDG